MRSVLSMAAFVLLVGPVAAADLTAEQVETEQKEIVGAWKLDFTTPDYVRRTPMVVVGRQYRQLVAWYIEEDEPEAFKTVQLNNDALTLTIRPKQRNDVTVTFEATLESEGVCVGTGTYTADDGDSGSWELKGKRMSPSDFDETQKWQLSFVAPDGQKHEPVVTVVSKDDQPFGWYSGKEHELPATKLTVNGDQVVLSLTVKTRDGDSVDVTFRGTVSADRVKGTADYDQDGETGSFPFTGERKS